MYLRWWSLFRASTQITDAQITIHCKAIKSNILWYYFLLLFTWDHMRYQTTEQDFLPYFFFNSLFLYCVHISSTFRGTTSVNFMKTPNQEGTFCKVVPKNVSLLAQVPFCLLFKATKLQQCLYSYEVFQKFIANSSMTTQLQALQFKQIYQLPPCLHRHRK